jgi:hypothetical protein
LLCESLGYPLLDETLDRGGEVRWHGSQVAQRASNPSREALAGGRGGVRGEAAQR